MDTKNNKMNWRSLKIVGIGLASFLILSIGINALVDWTTPTTEYTDTITGEVTDIASGKSIFEPLTNITQIGNMALVLSFSLIVSYYFIGLLSKNTVGKWLKSDEFDEGWNEISKPRKTMLALAIIFGVTCALIVGAKADTLPISKQGYDMILKYEVSSKSYYEKRLQRPTVPAPRTTASGVTIGFGYDCGYNSKADIARDWSGILSDSEVRRLQSVSGLKGMRAYYACKNIKNSVRVPWESAERVFQKNTLPRFKKLTAKAFDINADRLHPHCNGALVSTVFNRGGSMRNTYKRREMRWIKHNIAVGREDRVPSDFMVMRHQWSYSKLRGLWLRYEATSNLFALGLHSS